MRDTEFNPNPKRSGVTKDKHLRTYREIGLKPKRTRSSKKINSIVQTLQQVTVIDHIESRGDTKKCQSDRDVT